MLSRLRRFGASRRQANRSPASANAAHVYDPRQLETLVPATMTTEERIRMAVRCRDADAIAKVAGAGLVRTEPDGRRTQLLHNGIRVIADGYYGPWMTDLITRCKGHHEPQEERVFHAVLEHLPPGGTMLELGGYWAFYSIWFLVAGSGRRALIVEPDPTHIAIGKTNLMLNRVDAEFVQGFLGDCPGSAKSFTTEESGAIDLPCIDIVALLAERRVERLNILHCDAQGVEFDVLQQAASLLRARRIDWVFVSTHHHVISRDPLTHQRCLALLQQLGAHIVVEHDVQESFSGDGLICARFCDEPRDWKPLSISYNRSSESLFRHPVYDLAAKQTVIF